MVASIFLSVKFFGISHDNWMHLAVLRTLCVLFNVASLLVPLKLVREIELSTGTREAKDAERARLQKIFRGGVVRILIVGALHVGLKMMPPLLVSSAMAVFDILENPSIERLKKDKEN